MNWSLMEAASLGSSLPEDVMVEILLRLPVESVLRFKCVAKSCYYLINNPEFVAKHFSFNVTHDSSSSSTLLLKRMVFFRDYTSEKEKNIFSFLPYPLHPGGEQQSVIINIYLPFLEDSPCLDFRGHSHGLVCLSNILHDIVLCNPATREFRQLPPSILFAEPLKEDEDPFAIDSPIDAVGFGYDSRSMDFKVVRVVSFVESPRCLYPLRVEVYELSKDRWREIDSPVCGLVYSYPSFEMYYQGIYYWWAQNSAGEEIILSFHMSDELFGYIPLPETDSFNTMMHNYYITLGIWNGSMVLFHRESSVGDEKSFHIWVMEKNEDSGGGGVSWSMALTIGPFSGIRRPLLFLESGQLLMEAIEGGVVSYDIHTRELKNLHVDGDRARFEASHYTKSLLPVKGGNKIIIP